MKWISRFALFAMSLLAGCERAEHPRAFVLATTTSLEGSGLLRQLASEFKEATQIEVHPIVVGSGKALQLAMRGQADVTITHDPEAEKKVSPGAVMYRQFMHNEFIVVGPPENPSRLLLNDPVNSAFEKIHRTGSRFCSRNDRSGTHTRELRVWREIGLRPETNPGYIPLGQSMSALLRSASELGCYALSDQSTYDQLRHSLDLAILLEGDPSLRNNYAVMWWKQRPPSPSEDEAQRFVEWLLDEEGGLRVIENFRIENRPQFRVIRSR